MTWVDYGRAVQGYWLRHARYLEGVRRSSFFTVMANADPKKARSLKEEKLFRLITDEIKEQPKPVKLTPDQMRALFNRYKLN